MAMQQWEYLIVDHRYGGQIISDGKPLESKDIYQYLKQLGEQGWEMVGLGTAAGGTRYAFKRPKP